MQYIMLPECRGLSRLAPGAVPGMQEGDGREWSVQCSVGTEPLLGKPVAAPLSPAGRSRAGKEVGL